MERADMCSSSQRVGNDDDVDEIDDDQRLVCVCR